VNAFNALLQENGTRLTLPSPETAVDGRLRPIDPDIGRILELMHAQPELPWTVASLADRICISRSRFAERFKALLSKSPIQYLFEHRMAKACALLTEDHYKIKEIAARVGYSTEAAFSKAFKRWSGMAPGTCRKPVFPDADFNSPD
jgi:AraC-like DNA-binding protein